jgi:nucleotide-binding universal stress UspA family protein
MTNKVPFNSLLVPTDFSEHSWSAFQHALLLVDGQDSEIVVVHAIDPPDIDHMVELGIGEHDAILKSMRENALERLKRYADASTESTKIDVLVSEGVPFFEIVRKAEDFAVDAIVMSKLGQRDGANTLLFGSTAEKVIRASKKPVIVLPSD